MASNSPAPRRPAGWWPLVIAVCGGLAAACLIAAISFQRSATEPIGEGEVFVADVSVVERLTAASGDLDQAARHSRNALDVEAVSILDANGSVIASTSESLLDSTVMNPLLGFGIESRRFMALASPVPVGLEIDGVMEWPEGSVLYQVLAPLDDDRSALIYYDVSGLLARRTQPGEVQSETIQLLSLAGVFVLLGTAVAIGHMRAARRHRDMELESEILRQHSEELEATNQELDHALALAEEKMRIRSEFVLMINHELRTPLTSVVTGAELMNSGKLTPRDAAQVLRAMVADGHRLQEIIDQILAVARIENKGLSYELRPTPIRDVCEAVTDAHPNVRPGPSHGPHDGTHVTTDLGTLSIVVASLADNALTHGADEVTISCRDESSVVPMVAVGATPDSATFITIISRPHYG